MASVSAIVDDENGSDDPDASKEQRVSLRVGGETEHEAVEVCDGLQCSRRR